MRIDRTLIAHLQELARIELTAVEIEQLGEQLNRVVAYVERLRELESGDVEPGSFVVHEDQARLTAGLTAGLRADEPVGGLDRHVFLDQAPGAEGGFFKVPPIIEREGR